jgi:hypothetical protein
MAASHQRRLGVLGQRETLRRSLPHDGGQFFAERGIDLCEHAARHRKRFGKRLAHADGLASLPGKHEGDRHSILFGLAR